MSRPKLRAIHRVLGIVMLAPFLAWAATGAFFFIKPGYADAYASLAIKTYPLERALQIAPQPAWKEVRVVRTILGEHLLVRGERGWQHVDPVTLAARPDLTETEMRALLHDAFTASPARYGSIVSVAGRVVTTDTGVRVTLDWPRLSLSQRGRDTDRIDAIYNVHYLRWTGIEMLDRVVGAVGLGSVVVLSLAGARLFFRRQR